MARRQVAESPRISPRARPRRRPSRRATRASTKSAPFSPIAWLLWLLSLPPCSAVADHDCQAHHVRAPRPECGVRLLPIPRIQRVALSPFPRPVDRAAERGRCRRSQVRRPDAPRTQHGRAARAGCCLPRRCVVAPSRRSLPVLPSAFIILIFQSRLNFFKTTRVHIRLT